MKIKSIFDKDDVLLLVIISLEILLFWSAATHH